MNFPLTFAGGTTTGTVTVTETHSPVTRIVRPALKNAVCTESGATGNAVTVSNDGRRLLDPGLRRRRVSCNVWNRPPLPQSNFSVNKVWVVNGTTVPRTATSRAGSPRS